MAQRHPKALSGGQQQRVALARAMAVEPEVLLLDEPFSALDAKLRTQMRTEIRELQQQARITSVFVTHDQDEAMAIADRIGVMNQGRLEQLGSAEDLYERPASRFVATFIGQCNLIEGRVAAPGRFEAADGAVFAFEGPRPAGPAALCVRPERAALHAAPPAGMNTLPVTVRNVTYLGAGTEVEALAADGRRFLVSMPSAGAAPPPAGASTQLCWPPQAGVLVD
jgi:putative spermidine/putrescine transport system ATP-binding protein